MKSSTKGLFVNAVYLLCFLWGHITVRTGLLYNEALFEMEQAEQHVPLRALLFHSHKRAYCVEREKDTLVWQSPTLLNIDC